MPEEERRTPISDELWVRHIDVDGRLRGSMGGGAGASSIDLANAFDAIRDAIEEMEKRLAVIEEALGGKGPEEAEGESS